MLAGSLSQPGAGCHMARKPADSPIGGQERQDLVQRLLTGHLWMALDGQHPVLVCPDFIQRRWGGCEQLCTLWQLQDLQHAEYA